MDNGSDYKVYGQAELKKMLLQDIKTLIEEECTDEESWKMILYTYEFQDMAGINDFRSSAKDIFFGKRFPENIAKLIAGAFGAGSEAVRITYPKECWEVDIVEFPMYGRPSPDRRRYHSATSPENTFRMAVFTFTHMKLIAVVVGIIAIVAIGFVKMISDFISLL